MRGSPRSFSRRTKLTLPGHQPYLCSMDSRSRITFEPGKRGAQPCIRGLRITVTEALEYLASGMSEDEILRDFPDLTREDIRPREAAARPEPLHRPLVCQGGGVPVTARHSYGGVLRLAPGVRNN